MDEHFAKFIGFVKYCEYVLEKTTDITDYQKYLNMFKWKVIHSARVSMLCKELALNETFDEIEPSMINYLRRNEDGKLELNNDGIYLASLCGLYHDIGRFHQIVYDHTENDSESTLDHGTMGYNIISNNTHFKNMNLNKQDKNIIKETVKQHNQYKLNEDNTNDINYFCKLLRDADKIDIIKGLNEGKVPLLDQMNMPISDGVLDDINNERMVYNEHSINLNDRLATMFSYYFDINTNAAKEYIKEEKIFEKLYDKIEHKDDFEIIRNSKILKRGIKNAR